MTQQQIERYEALKKLSVYLPEWERLIDNTVKYQITSKSNTSADAIAMQLYAGIKKLINNAQIEIAASIKEI